MLDNKTLKRWLGTWSTIANAMHDLRIEGSQARDNNPDVGSLLFQAAKHLDDANRLINRAILLASAEEKNDRT